MSPSAATIRAATPKCTMGPGSPMNVRPVKLCGRQLVYEHDRKRWVCPRHGPVTTTGELVDRQAAA